MISQNVYVYGNETKFKTAHTRVEPTEGARYPVEAQGVQCVQITRVEKRLQEVLLTIYASCAHDATQEKPLNSDWSRAVN